MPGSGGMMHWTPARYALLAFLVLSEFIVPELTPVLVLSCVLLAGEVEL
jgi:hypothetical protein